MSIETVNPATGEPLTTYDQFSDDDVDRTLEQTDERFERWSNRSFEERASLMNRASTVLENKKNSHADLMAREMGKPLDQARSEVEKCAWVCEYYAEHAEEFLSDDHRESDASKSYVSYQPLGTVLAIMPWNYPFWQVFRFAAPSLMAGNTAVLKHAPNVTGCALAIETVFEEAGFPENTFRTLPISVEQTQSVIEDDRVKAVTLTGSTRAGQSVASRAGNEIKKTVLELGGSDPYLVLDDADPEKAAEICVNSRLLNSGQSCIAAKRFIVDESIEDHFTEAVREKMDNTTMGNPLESNVDLGPQAREDLRDELHDQVQRSISDGADCLLGGEVPDRDGYFYPATLLSSVGPGVTSFEEELFGPVASISSVSNEKEAIRLANDSDFGLGAAVITEDDDRGERIARDELEAGCCFVNAFVKSDPRLPFGGIKRSGYGRELSQEGIREFVNTKTVYVK
jgi:succinate-semialdehyde dehydrogenase/glutarate-semialdehyde dehydrogenase